MNESDGICYGFVDTKKRKSKRVPSVPVPTLHITDDEVEVETEVETLEAEIGIETEVEDGTEAETREIEAEAEADESDDEDFEGRFMCGSDMHDEKVYIGDTVLGCCNNALHVYYVDTSRKYPYMLVPIVKRGAPVRTALGNTTQAWHRASLRNAGFRDVRKTVKIKLGNIRVHM
jgi:hypothetical protein